MATLSTCMSAYDKLLSTTAERERWDDEELRAVICRYLARVDQFVDSIDGLQGLDAFLQAECQRANAALRERTKLALDVYATVEHATESFEEDHIGADLAYLLGAMLRGDSGCEWDADRPFVRLLKEHFPADDNPVWQHVSVIEQAPTVPDATERGTVVPSFLSAHPVGDTGEVVVHVNRMSCDVVSAGDKITIRLSRDAVRRILLASDNA